MENVGGWKTKHVGARYKLYSFYFLFKDTPLYLGLNVPIVDPSIKVDRLQILVDYFLDRKNNNDWYAMRFFFCEALNFVNVIGQIFFIDFFLGGEFTTYGRDVISISEMPSGDRMDPMSRVFPKVNICYLIKSIFVIC